MHRLTVEGVTKVFTPPAGGEPVEVLRGADLTMAGDDSAEGAGAGLAILGPSGSGKSTLLQIIGGLDRPTAGVVQLDDQRPFELDDDGLAEFRNRQVGFVFQDHHLLPQFSVLDNVMLPAFARPGSSGDRDHARQLLDRVGLGHRLDHRPAEISGGERQRVAVARALINHPHMLLCDEPTGSLDADSASAVAELLLDMQQHEGVLLIVVTHSLELAARFDRQVELRQGQCYER